MYIIYLIQVTFNCKTCITPLLLFMVDCKFAYSLMVKTTWHEHELFRLEITLSQ